MWGRAGQGLLLCGGRRLLASRAAAHLSAAAAADAAPALYPGCSKPPSRPSTPSSAPPSNGAPRAAPSPPRPLVGAVFASPADVAAEDGVCFVDPSPTRPLAQADPTLLQPRVVIYDGVCHLCHAGVKWVINADKHEKIKFCCLQSKAAEPYLRLCGLEREDVLQRFLFVEGLYSFYQGSTAALKVASYLPLPYSALSILLVIPRPLRDLIYDYVAKRRYDWFGKDEECIIVREKELIYRFIDREELLTGDKDKFS
ncbi:hypothetical protein Taro_010635 [Colocasia esculenta]|uniref:Thiol-disulfide oxidoreductase DCC n=1 Tax=Colocasia esculenta TaxID=4460 RepID=A0A843U463_COLES|nr:hypothetical protein [Colocasia esculenta]